MKWPMYRRPAGRRGQRHIVVLSGAAHRAGQRQLVGGRARCASVVKVKASPPPGPIRSSAVPTRRSAPARAEILALMAYWKRSAPRRTARTRIIGELAHRLIVHGDAAAQKAIKHNFMFSAGIPALADIYIVAKAATCVVVWPRPRRPANPAIRLLL